MKIRSALFIFSTFCTFCVSAQWTWRNPLPQGNDINVIRINSHNSVWAAGGTGTIMQSSDGGFNWQIQNVTRRTKHVEFVGLDFTEDSVYFAVDEYGYIFKSSDGGATWDSMYWEVDEYLLASCFTDKQNGFVACSDGKIIRTTDGGMTWDPWYFNEPVYFRSILFPSPLIGYVAGNGYILKTSDGGNSWNEVYFDTSAIIQSLAFASPTLGFATGDSGLVLKTTDGGATWFSQHLGDTIQFVSVGMFSPDTLILNGYSYVGGNNPSFPVKYRSTNSGITWNQLQLPVDLPFTTSIAASPGGTAYFAGPLGALVKTIDYGNTWISLYQWLSTSPSWGLGIYGIDFPTSQTGYAVMDGGEVPSGKILKTIDFGETWHELDTNFKNHALKAVDFVNENLGCIGGDNIYSTFDGGDTWILRLSVPQYWSFIRSISYASTSICIAVGDDGLFFRSTDCGQSWTEITTVPDVNYRSVCFTDETTGYAAGDHAIIKTTDAGVTWNLVSFDYNLLALDFMSQEMGVGVGLNGLIVRTTDGGQTWNQIDSPTTDKLYSVNFYDADTGYAAGGVEIIEAVVLKTTDGGMTWHEQFIPINYPLYAIVTTGNRAFTGGWFYNLFGTTNGGIAVSSVPLGDLRGHFISVFPNPASTVITVETNCPGQLSILSLSGQVLLICQVTESKSAIDINSLSAGVYVVRLVSDKGTQVGKFIKE